MSEAIEKSIEKLRKQFEEKQIGYTFSYFVDGGFKCKLDFSEHDKAFEDKIANLEKRMAYMKEKKNYLRTRCMEDATDAFDSGAYGRLTIVGRRVDLETENEKLKQRIAELESKESVKAMRIEFHADNGEMLTPLEVANSLINQNTFKVDELRELAEHLQVYCRHHNDKEAETISF